MNAAPESRDQPFGQDENKDIKFTLFLKIFTHGDGVIPRKLYQIISRFYYTKQLIRETTYTVTELSKT